VKRAALSAGASSPISTNVGAVIFDSRSIGKCDSSIA
jgi:hypothetical protein